MLLWQESLENEDFAMLTGKILKREKMIAECMIIISESSYQNEKISSRDFIFPGLLFRAILKQVLQNK